MALSTTKEKYSRQRQDWVLSTLLTATIGCLVVTFFGNLLFYSTIAGLLYPFFAALLMVATHRISTRGWPDSDYPEHLRVQLSVIIGGLISVAIIFSISGRPRLEVLLPAGLALGSIAALSILLENISVYRETLAAKKAAIEAEEAKRLADDGHLGAALESLQESLLATEIAYGSRHQQVAKIVTYLGDVLRDLDHQGPCILMYERAIKIYESLPEEAESHLSTLRMLSTYLRQTSSPQQAVQVSRQAVRISRLLYGESPITASCLLSEAQAQLSSGELNLAYKAASAATQIFDINPEAITQDSRAARGLVASICLKLGRTVEAERLLREIITTRQNHPEHPPDADYLNALLDLSIACRREGSTGADATFQQAIDAFRAWVGPQYERSSEILELLPAYLAPQDSHLYRFYTILCSNEPSGCRQVLREHPEIAKETDRSQWTPLLWATLLGSPELVTDLLSRGANLDFARGKGFPALYIAARWGRHRILSSILRSGADVDIDIDTIDASRPLHGAVRSGSQLAFDILISNNASVHATNSQGWTALHEAAYRGQRKFLVRLISEGADINLQAPPHYDTPLHAAVKGGSWVTTETLILNLAKDSLLDADELLPIELATKLHDPQIEKVLHTHASPAALNIVANKARPT